MAHKLMSQVSAPNADELMSSMRTSNSENDFASEMDDKKKRKESKRIFAKKESKDKGYSNLSLDQTQQESLLFPNKSPPKKVKGESKIGLFKKSSKDEKKVKDAGIAIFKPNKEKDEKQKKAKRSQIENGLFGNSLQNTIATFPCNDGIHIPYPIRICFEIVEEKGLECEGIYKKNVEKNQMETMCDLLISNFELAYEELNANPLLASAVIKKFLRELKSPLINDELISSFDKCDTISNKDAALKIENISNVINRLAPANRDTFSFLVVHLSKVIQKSDINKMDMSHVIMIFQPIIRIKDRLLKFIVKNSSLIFKNFKYKKYRNKLADDTISRMSMLPDNIQDIEAEIAKQETILYELHSKINDDKNKNLQDQYVEELWTLQRYITSLKRKVRKLKQEQKTSQMSPTPLSTPLKANSLNNSSKRTLEDSIEATGDSKIENSQINEKFKCLYDEDVRILCENELLIENLRQMIEKINKEKVKIFDLQQQLNSLNPMLFNPNQREIKSYENVNLNDLVKINDQLMYENKSMEDKINTLCAKIAKEKEKVFDLKLNIQFKTFQDSLDRQDAKNQQMKSQNSIFDNKIANITKL